MKKRFLLLFLCTSAWASAQELSPQIQEVHKFDETSYANHENQVSQKSAYKLLGATKRSIVVREVVTVYCHKAFDYSYENEVILHYFDRKTMELWLSKSVWVQSQRHKAKRPNRGGVNILDQVPQFLTFKNRLYMVTPRFREANSQYEDFTAVKANVFIEQDTGLEIRAQLIHAKAHDFAPFELKVADDSSYLYALSQSLLKDEHRGDYRYGMRFFNRDLKAYRYLPLGFIYGFYAFENYISYLSPGDRIAYSETFESYDALDFNLYDLTSGENRQQRLDGLRYSSKHAIHINEVMHRSDSTITLVLGLKCALCAPSISLYFNVLEVNLDPSASEFTKITSAPIIRLEETDDGDQHEDQYEYFKWLNSKDLDQEDAISIEAEEVQHYDNLATASAQYVVVKKDLQYTLSTPLFLCPKGAEEVFALNRVINMDSIHSHQPMVIDVDDEYISLLANYSVPVGLDGKLYFSSKSPQILQFVTVDLIDQTVARSNISDHFEYNMEADTYFVNPEDAFVLDRNCYSMMKSKRNETYLTRIYW